MIYNKTQQYFPWHITAANNNGFPGGWHTITFPVQTNDPVPSDDPDQIEIDFAAVVGEKKINKDGCKCKKCKEFYPFAEANQSDGTLICWACRKGY